MELQPVVYMQDRSKTMYVTFMSQANRTLIWLYYTIWEEPI